MSVLIKQFKFPKCCYSCLISDYTDDVLYCDLVDSVVTDFVTLRHPDCPLVDVPTPHGRLGDLDKLKSKFRHGNGDNDADSAWISTIRRAITKAETIIEAESEET